MVGLAADDDAIDVAVHRLVGDYLVHLRAARRAPESVYAIGLEVRRWVRYCRGQPFAATAGQLDRYLAGRPLGARATATALSHLRGFYRWAARAGLTTLDPTVTVERPRLPRPVARPIADEDLAVALELADAELRAMLALGAFGGLRCVEMANLAWADFGTAEMVLHGKGGHQRLVPVHPIVLDAVVRLERAGPVVFPMRARRRAQRISARINRHLRAVGVTATAHQLRHWFGTETYQNVRDLAVVQDLLGHASPATTRIYVRANRAQARDAVAGLQLPVWQPTLEGVR